MVIQREITGPRAEFERSGVQSFRDVRPISARLAEALRTPFSGVILTVGAFVAYLVPETVNIVTPVAAAFAVWVLSQRVVAPLRLPATAGLRDWGDPDPKNRKPRRAAGTIYLGIDWLTAKELWLSQEDGGQHGSIPGTTGSGKTTAIVSFLANPLAQGSGFVLVDGKGDNTLVAEVMALAARFGRLDDVLVLNFLVASGAKDSNSFNPFAIGNADAIRELLASQLGEQRPDDANGVFRARAIALIGTMAPVLTWMRDHKQVPINIETIRFALELRGIWKLATRRVFERRDPQTGIVEEIAVPEMPEDLVYPLQAYLGEIPGYDNTLDYNMQKSDEPSKQHGFALFYFTATFTQLAVSLGHIFKVQHGDIDMRDVVLNRRILVVLLPALENSDDTLAALGKIVVASLRGMQAQILGARLEGDYEEIVANKPGMGAARAHVVFDEVAYYATSGMDRMLAMARGLNIMIWLSFQELAGIRARLGEKTNSLLANANLTIGMRQQDSGRTREWIEKTGGKAEVTQATSYFGGQAGDYREAGHAELREVDRVKWLDLQRLLPGEAIILFAGRRVHAKLFHAALDPRGRMRLNRTVSLAPPAPDIGAELGRRQEIAASIAGGALAGAPVPDEQPTLGAMVAALAAAAGAGADTGTCIAAAFEAARAAPFFDPKGGFPGASAEIVNTPFTPMLDDGLEPHPGGPADARAADPIDAKLLQGLLELELARGIARPAARATALAVLALRDAALEPRPLPKPEPMAPEELCRLIDELTALVRSVGPPEEPR